MDLLTVPNVYGLLIRSKLLPLEECQAMYTRWQQEAKDNANNLAMFAKWLVTNRYVTEYQSMLLARGHAEGFFINGYKIIDRLGRGRMAGVYKAQHETGPIVAIKVLPPSKAKDPSLLARFQREARVAVRLKHPNVVRTFQVNETSAPSTGERLYYLVMEYIEGEPLDEVLQRRRQFLPGEAVRLIHQALRGLHHLHEQGLVHRDIKPANLMLAYPPGSGPQNDTLRATVKILDMGLARTLSDEYGADPERLEQVHLTSEGIVLGTPDYMAPEQARDARGADVRADIYSLGCVLYHLLDGRPPFPDTNIISQMIRHATEAPRPLKQTNPAVPDGLQQIVSTMLAKDPAQRYPTPEKAAVALQTFLAAGGDMIPTPEADPRMKKYLTFLEIDSAEAEKRSKSATLTPGKPPSGQPTIQANVAPRRAKLAGRKKGKKRRSHPGMNLGKKNHPPAGPAPGANVDVELVTMVPRPSATRGILPFTRRDFSMYGLGIATVAIGAGIGYLFALFSGAFEKEEPEDSGNPNE